MVATRSGNYKAITSNYNQQRQSLSRTFTFWALYWPLCLLSFLLLFCGQLCQRLANIVAEDAYYRQSEERDDNDNNKEENHPHRTLQFDSDLVVEIFNQIMHAGGAFARTSRQNNGFRGRVLQQPV